MLRPLCTFAMDAHSKPPGQQSRSQYSVSAFVKDNVVYLYCHARRSEAYEEVLPYPSSVSRLGRGESVQDAFRRSSSRDQNFLLRTASHLFAEHKALQARQTYRSEAIPCDDFVLQSPISFRAVYRMQHSCC